MFLQIVDVAAHIGVVFGQHLGISVMLIELIRNFDNGASPATGAASASRVRGRILDVAGDGILTVGNILHPFFIEASCIQNRQGGVTGQLTVPRITSALQVGAIRGIAQVHIAEHGVNEGVVRPVSGLVVALKGRGTENVGVDFFYARRSSVSFHLKM